MAEIVFIFDGVTIPKATTYSEKIQANETTNQTLGGKYYTDYVSNNRVWFLTWDNLKESDYQKIYTLYKNQYKYNRYGVLRIDAFGINVPAKMEVNEHNISYNGSIRKNFSISIIEQFPFS